MFEELMAIDGGFCVGKFCIGLLCSVGTIVMAGCCVASAVVLHNPHLTFETGALTLSTGAMAGVAFYKAFTN